MISTNRLAGMFFAVLALLGVTSVGSAVEPTAIQASAQRSVTDGAARLTKLAYVTALSHTKTEFVRGNVYKDDSFDLTYKFYYRDSDNDPQSYTLRFVYSANGRLINIATVSHTSFWEPFNALKLAGAFIEQVAKELDK